MLFENLINNVSVYGHSCDTATHLSDLVSRRGLDLMYINIHYYPVNNRTNIYNHI